MSFLSCLGEYFVDAGTELFNELLMVSCDLYFIIKFLSSFKFTEVIINLQFYLNY